MENDNGPHMIRDVGMREQNTNDVIITAQQLSISGICEGKGTGREFHQKISKGPDGLI